MAIHYITIKGRIKDGVLEAKVPADIQDGEIEISLPVSDPLPLELENTWKDRPWTKEELDELIKPNPMTLGQLLESGLIGGWKDRDITDGQEFIEQLRREEEEKRGVWKPL